MPQGVQLDFSRAQPLTLDFSKAQSLQGAPIPAPTGPTGLKAVTLADRVKRAINEGKESLPYIGAAAGVGLTPATGGLSDILMPLVAAALGGAGGTAAKHVVAAGINSGDRPKTMTDALQQDVTGGLNQAEYEAGGRSFGAVLGKLLGDPATKFTRSQLANLTAMTGGEGTGTNYAKILPDLNATVKQMGRPQTPLGVYNVLEATSKGYDTAFNNALAPIGRNRIVPMDIADRIRSLITPNMVQTAEGRAERKELLAAAVEYEKPWTLYQLNAQRMANNNRLSAFYRGDTQAQATALTQTQKGIMKAVRDEAADILYDAVDKVNPDLGTRLLKQKQGAAWSLRDQLDTQIEKITDAQLTEEGKTLRQKVSPSAVVTPRGTHGYIRGVSKLIPGGGPERQANIQATKAFDPNRYATRARVLRMPAANFMRALGMGGSMATEGDDSGQ